jgi:hypothetical protein
MGRRTNGDNIVACLFLLLVLPPFAGLIGLVIEKIILAITGKSNEVELNMNQTN